MPSTRRAHLVSWAKFRVTVVAIVAVLILMTLVYLLSGGTLLKSESPFYLYLPDATGLAVGTPVRVNGIVVGHVDSVSLTRSSAPGRVIRVEMHIPNDRLSIIPQDSYAQTQTDSLVGDKLIEITSGNSPTPIRPGSELPFKAQEDMMKSLDLTQFENQLRAVDAMLTDIETGRSAVGQFVLGDQMYNDVNRRISEIQRAVHAAADTSGSLGKAMYTDALYQQIRDPILKIDQALARLQAGQGTAGALLRNAAQFDSIRQNVADLRKSVTDLRASAFVTSDEAYTSWVKMVSGWVVAVDQINYGPMFNTSEMYESLNGSVKQMRDTMRDFRENPRKYLRLKVF